MPREKDGSIILKDYSAIVIEMLIKIMNGTKADFFKYDHEEEFSFESDDSIPKLEDKIRFYKNEIIINNKKKELFEEKLKRLNSDTANNFGIANRIKNKEKLMKEEADNNGENTKEYENLTVERNRLMLKRDTTSVGVSLNRPRLEDEIKKIEQKLKLNETNIESNKKQIEEIKNKYKKIGNPEITFKKDEYTTDDYFNLIIFIHTFFKGPQTNLLIKPLIEFCLWDLDFTEIFNKKQSLFALNIINKFYPNDRLFSSFAKAHDFTSALVFKYSQSSIRPEQFLLTKSHVPKIVIKQSAGLPTLVIYTVDNWKSHTVCKLKTPKNCKLGEIFTNEDGSAIFFSALLLNNKSSYNDEDYSYSGVVYYDLEQLKGQVELSPKKFDQTIPLLCRESNLFLSRNGGNTLLSSSDVKERIDSEYHDSVSFLVDSTASPLVGYKENKYIFRKRNGAYLIKNIINETVDAIKDEVSRGSDPKPNNKSYHWKFFPIKDSVIAAMKRFQDEDYYGVGGLFDNWGFENDPFSGQTSYRIIEQLENDEFLVMKDKEIERGAFVYNAENSELIFKPFYTFDFDKAQKFLGCSENGNFVITTSNNSLYQSFYDFKNGSYIYKEFFLPNEKNNRMIDPEFHIGKSGDILCVNNGLISLFSMSQKIKEMTQHRAERNKNQNEDEIQRKIELDQPQNQQQQKMQVSSVYSAVSQFVSNKWCSLLGVAAVTAGACLAYKYVVLPKREAGRGAL